MNDIEIEQELQNLRQSTAPFSIDVTPQVMAAIGARPNLLVVRRMAMVRRWTLSSAAAIALLVGVALTMIYTRDYNEEQVSDMLATVYDYQPASPDAEGSVLAFVEEFCIDE